MLSVILKSSVRGLGKAGEVAKVKPGYARYLLAGGKAVRATKDNIALLGEKLALIEEENRKKLAEAEEIGKALASECLIMIRQASDDGKLFGSVTVRDVAKLLCDLGYNVQPREVFFGGLIKRTGEYEVSIELHADLVAVLTLHVVKNEADAERVKLGIARGSAREDQDGDGAGQADVAAMDAEADITDVADVESAADVVDVKDVEDIANVGDNGDVLDGGGAEGEESSSTEA
ncbi:MAG: 50S ribosomal protein L9 [Anaplasma sp.]